MKMNDKSDIEWFYQIKAFLLQKKLCPDIIHENIVARTNGRTFPLQDHIKGLIYSLLSNQRPWISLVPKLPQIDDIFFNFNVREIKKYSSSYFVSELRKIKCGNRNIKLQMHNLFLNIEKMETIEKFYGSMDNFLTSAPAFEIVKKISSPTSKYKFYNLGPALAWEYLRNVGIDGAKPDIHLCRFFSKDRMGEQNSSPASVQEVFFTVKKLSELTGLSMAEIDAVIWNFCAQGFGAVCTATPLCSECPICNYCKYPQSS